VSWQRNKKKEEEEIKVRKEYRKGRKGVKELIYERNHSPLNFNGFLHWSYHNRKLVFLLFGYNLPYSFAVLC
jgi:hypothetical protein